MAKGKIPETDQFARLATVTAGPKKSAAGSADEAPILTIPELGPYGVMNKLNKELESWRKGEGCAPIVEAFIAYAIKEGVRLGLAPPNVKGIDGNNLCIASIVLSQKDNRSNMAEHAKRFAELGIELGSQEYAPATVRVNPEIWARQDGKHIVNKALDILGKNKEIGQLLEKAGIDFTDLFQIQADNSYPIVGKYTINTIFARAKEAREEQAKTGEISNEAPWDDAMVRELLGLVASPVVTPRQVYCELPDTLVEARKRLCPTPEDIAEAKKAKAKPTASAKAPVAPKPRDPVAESVKVSLGVRVAAGGLFSKPATRSPRR